MAKGNVFTIWLRNGETELSFQTCCEAMSGFVVNNPSVYLGQGELGISRMSEPLKFCPFCGAEITTVIEG